VSVQRYHVSLESSLHTCFNITEVKLCVQKMILVFFYISHLIRFRLCEPHGPINLYNISLLNISFVTDIIGTDRGFFLVIEPVFTEEPGTYM